MLVVDANDVRGSSMKSDTKPPLMCILRLKPFFRDLKAWMALRLTCYLDRFGRPEVFVLQKVRFAIIQFLIGGPSGALSGGGFWEGSLA